VGKATTRGFGVSLLLAACGTRTELRLPSDAGATVDAPVWVCPPDRLRDDGLCRCTIPAPEGGERCPSNGKCCWVQNREDLGSVCRPPRPLPAPSYPCNNANGCIDDSRHPTTCPVM